VHKLTSGIVSFMIEQGNAREENRDIYEYGIFAVLSTILSLSIEVFVGAVFHVLPEALVTSMGFIVLRSNCGGYHAKTSLRCTILSAAVYATSILCIRFAPQAVSLALTVLFMAGGTASILKLAPVAHPNRPFTDEERDKFRGRARICAFLGLPACLLLLLLDVGTIALALSFAFVMCGVAVVAQARITARHTA